MKRILVCLGIVAFAGWVMATEPPASPVKNKINFTGKFYLVKDVSEVPTLTKPANPEYPYKMRGGGLEGQAEIAYIVNEKGRTEEVQVATATNEEFGEAAKAAVRKWRFKPGKLDGQPVRIAILQTVTFNLR